MNPPWQDVQQEPSDELGGVQCQCALLPRPVVLAAEGDPASERVEAEQAPVGEGHPMGVAGQVLGLFVFDWTGAVAATAAFMLGRVAGCGYLEVDRRYEKKPQRQH